MDRVRPSFMTKDQLDRYMKDARQSPTPRPRPNFELPTKRLSLSLAEETSDIPTEEPKPEPLTRVQSDTVSGFRRFGGSVRDIQRSKGTLRTRNGWIVGDNSERRSNWSVGRKTSAPPAVVEVSRVPEKVAQIVVKSIAEQDEEKENIPDDIDTSQVEVSLEDSITQLQDDISQEIEAVGILLDSPIEEKDLSPTVEDVQDECDASKSDPKPESPAPLKITRTQPVNIKPKVLHSSQMPEPPLPVTNNKKLEYSVNAPPTPSSSPPELEKRPKFEDRGVPTHAPVAPPTPPTKVMIMEEDRVVGEMTLDDGSGDLGYNVQQDKNPNAVLPSSDVSKIASKISELQLKADPSKAAPKPTVPSISMEEFTERNQTASAPIKAATPASAPVTENLQMSFARTNSMPPTLPSHTTSAAPVATQKAYERPQYKPYRPPTQPVPLPVKQPKQPQGGQRVGSQPVMNPQPSPSPAPFANRSQFNQYVPPQPQGPQGRHSSLGSIYQHGQQAPPPQAPMHNYGRNPHQWQNQPAPVQQAPPQLPTHSAQHRPPMPMSANNGQFQRNFPVPPSQSTVAPRPSMRAGASSSRSLPPLPTEAPKLAIEPSVPINSFDESQESPKTPSPTTAGLPNQSQPNPPIPTFAFDEVEELTARRLPAVPNKPVQEARTMPPVPSIAVNDDIAEKRSAPKPPMPTFSFSDDSSSAQPNIPTIAFTDDDDSSKPSIPMISLPDDDTNSKPPVPVFSFSGPDEASDKRPLPTPVVQKQESRPLPTPRGNPSGNSIADRRAAFETHSHHANSRIPVPRSAASCTGCGNHISARAVSASGLRFHPECFRCSHCSTRLEHVAFYPEPLGPDAPPDAPCTGRFYCHLDFHELFSPRCKSCKTPIEGEVVEACGATWHAGHFFCAECGDPFDSQSRFVEKDKYAWCLKCYQRRYSSKCKKCKKPVMDTVVKALDADWHMECFCCFQCGSEFQDGRYFLRDGCHNEPVCTKCEETRLKTWDLVQ